MLAAFLRIVAGTALEQILCVLWGRKSGPLFERTELPDATFANC